MNCQISFPFDKKGIETTMGKENYPLEKISRKSRKFYLKYYP